jgi:hypothetical protein
VQVARRVFISILTEYNDSNETVIAFSESRCRQHSYDSDSHIESFEGALP